MLTEAEMPAVEERVARLEGRVTEISEVLADLRAAVRHLEQRMDHFEQRMNARFDALDQKMSRQFVWLVGIQITSLLTVVATLGAIIAAVLART
jgi:uncharacterized coiled-coil protein SlyX